MKTFKEKFTILSETISTSNAVLNPILVTATTNALQNQINALQKVNGNLIDELKIASSPDYKTAYYKLLLAISQYCSLLSLDTPEKVAEDLDAFGRSIHNIEDLCKSIHYEASDEKLISKNEWTFLFFYRNCLGLFPREIKDYVKKLSECETEQQISSLNLDVAEFLFKRMMSPLQNNQANKVKCQNILLCYARDTYKVSDFYTINSPPLVEFFIGSKLYEKKNPVDRNNSLYDQVTLLNTLFARIETGKIVFENAIADYYKDNPENHAKLHLFINNFRNFYTDCCNRSSNKSLLKS